MIDEVGTKKPVMLFRHRSIPVFACISQPLICFWNATADDLDEVCKAYTSLWSSVSCESDARDVYDSLVAIALTDAKPYPIDWLINELRFEAFAAATGDRQWAALMDLQKASEQVADTELDLYNERLSREV